MADIVEPSLLDAIEAACPASPARPASSPPVRDGVDRAVIRRRILEVLRTQGTATADDFRSGEIVVPASRNSWGAVIKGMASSGEIVSVGFRKSQRPEARGRWVQAWALPKPR